MGRPTESGAWYPCPLFAPRPQWIDETFAARFPCPEYWLTGSCHPGPAPGSEDICETHGRILIDCIRDKDAEVARHEAALTKIGRTRLS